MITDGNGNIVWRWDQQGEPFGNTLPNQNPSGTGTPFVFNPRFAGQYYDVETGTYYNANRDYDPVTGRYLESDPIGQFGGLNTYTYVANQPLKYTDRRGLDNPSMGPYGPYYAWTPWPEPIGQGIQPVCPECALPAMRLAGWLKTISDLLKSEKNSPQSCQISFGRNQNQIDHANRHLIEDGVDPVAAQQAVTKDINQLNANGQIVNGLNNGSVTVNGVTVDYAAYRLPDGSINVGRMTVP